MSHAGSYRRVLGAAGPPALVFVAAWLFRFLTMGALENDHFVVLARAHQVLHGDWPVRDFFDPGQPLAYMTSAAAAAVFGPTLLTDVALATTILALAAALTYVLSLRASGSVLVALAAVAVELAAYPRLYNASKLLIPLGAAAFGWRYADAPSVRRLVVLAGWTAVAFLWRHDYAVYVALPAVALFALCHERDLAVRRVGLYAGTSLAFVAPWLVYVQWSGGLVHYAVSAVRFAATEGQRTVVGWPTDPGQLAWFLGLLGLPVVAIALARRPGGRLTSAHVTFVAAMALVADMVLLRDVIATRLPDVVGLAAVLTAWMVGRLVPRPWLRGAALLGIAVVGLGAAAGLAARGYGVPTPAKVARRFATVATMLAAPSPEVIPNRERLPLIDYLSSCTPAASRVLVSGFAPEIAVLAHRPFAGGLPAWLPGYYVDRDDVEQAAARLAHETVSVAVMLEGSSAFVRAWPQLAADLRARRFVERTWALDHGEVVVWIPDEVATTAGSAPPRCTAP